MKNNYCVIMAGGIGARFWPMSTSSKPKQFIDILGTGRTLLQQTFDRFAKLCPVENIYIVTNQAYEKYVTDQLPSINPSQILKEPARRNTAPCIAYASYKINQINPNAKIVVAPSDHLILKEEKFVEAINQAFEAIDANDWLITLGIQPNRPDTGYGYIQFSEKAVPENSIVRKVKTFTEKPDLEIAKTFLESGDFLWNAGIFIWTAKSILNGFEKFLPEIDSNFKGVLPYLNSPKETEEINMMFPTCKNVSIDYGIMEKAKNVYVIPCEIGWSDLGTWGSLYEKFNKNADGNAIAGNNVITYDVKNSVINMPKGKLLVVQGLEDYIIVENNNVMLICKKSEEQQIKQFVNNVRVLKGDQFI